jgi:hypothetical protein
MAIVEARTALAGQDEPIATLEAQNAALQEQNSALEAHLAAIEQMLNDAAAP